MEASSPLSSFARARAQVIPPNTFERIYGERNKLFDVKVAVLKSNLLYRHWPIEELYKMASRMSRRVLRPKQPVSRSDSSEVVFIQTGSLKIFRQGGKDASIEVALLGPDDIFGLVEMMGFFEATRWAVAQTASEVFVISMSIARELSVADARTSVEINHWFGASPERTSELSSSVERKLSLIHI